MAASSRLGDFGRVQTRQPCLQLSTLIFGDGQLLLLNHCPMPRPAAVIYRCSACGKSLRWLPERSVRPFSLNSHEGIDGCLRVASREPWTCKELPTCPPSPRAADRFNDLLAARYQEIGTVWVERTIVAAETDRRTRQRDRNCCVFLAWLGLLPTTQEFAPCAVQSSAWPRRLSQRAH